MASQKTQFKIRKPITSDDEKELMDFSFKLSQYGNNVKLDYKHPSYILVTMSVDDEIDITEFNKFTKKGY